MIFYKKGGKKIAKIKGPLLSIYGTGKIGKTIIFRKRKKAFDAKKYVIPYNPKTEDQGKQRDYLKNAVLAWKTDGYTALDIEAWNLYAKIQKKNLSGYNMFIRERINADKGGKDWTPLWWYEISIYSGTRVKVYIYTMSNLEGIMYLGTSKYSILKQYVCEWSEGWYYFLEIEDLNPKTRYYCYIANTKGNEVARTGIYTFKTLDV